MELATEKYHDEVDKRDEVVVRHNREMGRLHKLTAMAQKLGTRIQIGFV